MDAEDWQTARRPRIARLFHNFAGIITNCVVVHNMLNPCLWDPITERALRPLRLRKERFAPAGGLKNCSVCHMNHDRKTQNLSTTPNNTNIVKIHTARWGLTITGLAVFLAITICVSCSVGVAMFEMKIHPLDVLKIFGSVPSLIKLPVENWTTEEVIVLRYRVPRVFMALLIGGALTLAGIAFQALLRNPLAEPYILGISSGGSLGAMTAISLGINAVMGLPTLPFFAFAGALLTMMLVYYIALIEKRVHPHTLLLAGVIVGFFFSAIINFLITVVSSEEAHSFQFWMMGDLDVEPGMLMLVVTICLVVSGIIIACYARNFNLLVLGEEAAMQLGVDVERMKLVVFILASLMTGAAVSACGMIGFVGLIIPHIGRMLFGVDHRILIPASTLLGAAFLILADTLARTILGAHEIPVGVVTAICGGPFFIYLLRKRKKTFFA